MDSLSYKTLFLTKEQAKKDQKWLLVDAEGLTVGKLAANVAKILKGKHKPGFTPHNNCGDNVVILNAEKIVFSGDKMNSKVYVRHTGYPGGQRFTTPAQLMKKHPERILEKAIKGMLPKTILGSEMYRHVYVYAGTSHPHAGQQPVSININDQSTWTVK